MKTPTDDIFQLIQSMTAAEKRYFKIHFSSEKSLVTELFNFLNGMKVYKEDEVKRNFQETKLSKNLKVYKIMLMELLLKSLSSFGYKKSINSFIRQNLEEVEILTEKCLYAQAYKKLIKTKKTCFKHEEYVQLLKIIDLEYKFQAFYEIKTASEPLKLIDEKVACSLQIKEIFELKRIVHELSVLAGKVSEIHTNIEKIKKYEAPLIQKLKALNGNDLASFKVRYYLHAALGHLYHGIRSFEKEYISKKNILTLFQEHKHFMESNPKKYWSSIFNFANCCLRTNRSKEFEETLDMLKNFSKNNFSFQRKMILVNVMEMAYHQKKQNFNFIIDKLEPTTLKLVEKYGETEERSVVYSYISLMMTYLSVGNHTKVQFYLRRLFQIKGLENSYNYFFETIDMISHFESGDIDILQNLLTSKKRKLKREPKYGTPFFNELLRFFSELIDHNNDIATSINRLKNKASESSDDEFLRLSKYFFLEDWINAVAAKKTFAQQILSKR